MDRCKLIAAAAIGWLAGAFGEQLVNPGFEEPTADGAIPGWTWSCDDSVARVSVVAGAGVGGSKALLVEKRSSEKEFVARQRIRLAPRGHYRVTCRIRTADFHCADLNLNGTALRVQHVNGADFFRRWADVLAAANEVKANEATILSPPGPVVVDVSSPDLKVRTWEVGGRTVALVVNGAYRPVSGTVLCAGRAPLEVRLGALAHGYYVLQK